MKDQASQGTVVTSEVREDRHWVDGMKYTRMSGYDVGGSSSRRLSNRVYIIKATGWRRKTGAELSVSGASDVRASGVYMMQ